MNAAAARARKAANELRHLYNEKAIANVAGFEYPAFKSRTRYWTQEMVAAKTAYYNAKAKRAKTSK